jgi:hypothetical protein
MSDDFDGLNRHGGEEEKCEALHERESKRGKLS